MKLISEVLTLERRLIGVDTETTGVDVEKDSIVEIALEIYDPGKPVKEWRSHVNPGRPIPPAATAIHKITDDMVKNAPKFSELAENIFNGFKDADFIGYGLRFDLPLLRAEFKRCGLGFDYSKSRRLDPLRLWQIAEPRTLSDAAKRFLAISQQAADEVEEGKGAHSALFDVKIATRVAAAQLLEFTQLPRDLKKLHDLCWPAEYDPDGKMAWVKGELVFTFGKHKGESIRTVPRGYLNWLIDQQFSDFLKQTWRAAAAGNFPCLTNTR